MADSYWNERPGESPMPGKPVPGTDDGWKGEGGGGGGGGGSGDGSWWWQWHGGSNQTHPNTPGSIIDKTCNLPLLKISTGGLLLLESGQLLIGQLVCVPIPSVMLFLSAGSEHNHCALARLSDPTRIFSKTFASSECDTSLGALGYWYPSAGEFDLLVRWQGGHYDYAQINTMRLIVYGVDLGWRKVPLSEWGVAAHIVIPENGPPTVNNLIGNVRGNRIMLNQLEVKI